MSIRMICVVLWLSVCSVYGQEEILLIDIDSVLLQDIRNQGMKAFKKSECYIKHQKYHVLPYFGVFFRGSLRDLPLKSKEDFLENLYIKRSKKRGLLNNIDFNVMLRYDPCVSSTSDWKRFYCYNDKDSRAIFALPEFTVDNVAYYGNIAATNGFIDLIVTTSNEVYAYDSQHKVLMTFEEYGKYYKEKEIPNLLLGL